MPATVKTHGNSAGAGTQDATPDSEMIYLYDQTAVEPYLERYIEIVSLSGLVTDLPPGQWQKTNVTINGISATKIEDPDPQTFVVYSFALPDLSGALNIYVTKDPQRATLANQILSTFKFLQSCISGNDCPQPMCIPSDAGCTPITCRKGFCVPVLNAPIMHEYDGKIVYGPALSPEETELARKDCAERNGNFNTCGNICEPGAQGCVEVCATTCEY